MSTNCSFTQSFSGFAATEIIRFRDEVMADEANCGDCCDAIIEGFARVPFGLAFAGLFVANVIEGIARIFFALVTLPVALFKDGQNFYSRVSMAGLLNTLGSLPVIAHAFFANICQKSIQLALVNDAVFQNEMLGRQFQQGVELGGAFAASLFSQR